MPATLSPAPAIGAVPVPLPDLLLQVYESAPAEQQQQILSQLVGQVYAAAPMTSRKKLLEPLLKAVGVLALVSVAHGIFAKIRLHSGWSDMQGHIDDLAAVQAQDVVELVDRVQRVSWSALDSFAQALLASPGIASTAAAGVLLTLLLRHSQQRQHADQDLLRH